MLNTIITSTPIYVCSILSILLILSLIVKWDKARFWLLILMLGATILYIGNYAFYNHIVSVTPITDSLYCFTYPAIFPLYLIHIEALVLKKFNNKHVMLYLLPAFICGLSAGLIYATISEEEFAQFISYHQFYQNYDSLTGPAWWLVVVHRTARVIYGLEIPIVLFYGWRYISDYNKMVENYYSNTEDKVVTLIKPLLIAFVAASLISFICNLIERNQFEESLWLPAIPALSFTTLMLLFGFVGLTQNIYTREVMEESAKMDNQETEEDMLALTQEKEQIMADEIRKLMDEKKLFLQPNLKINDLAMMLNTNRNYIYHAINGKIGLSFSDYINQKRIEHAIYLIDHNPDMLLTDVAIKSGFSSPSSFYRNFKTIAGCSPSDYQKKQDANNHCQHPA